MMKLIYSREDKIINIVSPCEKENLLEILSNYTKEQFLENIQKQINSGNELDVHQGQNKLNWINTIQDWDNITDDEINRFHECFTIPNSTKVRWLDDSIFPADLTFRPAWCDVTNSPGIDIDCNIAKNVQLDLMRQQISEKLSVLDTQQLIAIGKKDQATADAIESKKQTLRDATNSLIALDCTSQINNDALLSQIKTLGIVPDVGV